MTFQPYSNEPDSLSIGGMTVENQADHVSMLGSVQITRDKAGLSLALELKKVIDATVTELESADLPDKMHLLAKPTIDESDNFYPRDRSGDFA
jgi:hypothetical protein